MALLTIIPKNQIAYFNRQSIVPALQNLQVHVYNPESLVLINVNYIGTEVEWLDLTGQIENDPLMLLQDLSGDATVQLALINLDGLSGNYYVAEINFKVGGITYTHKVELYLSGTVTLITTDKTTYNLVYDRSTDTLSGDTLVTILNNTEADLLKFWQNGNIFEAAENFTDNFTLSENSDIPLASNPALPATGNVTIPAKILKQTGEFLSGFTINLLVIDGGISVTPENLYFEIFKAPGNEKSSTLSVVNPLAIDYEITEYPTWVTLDSTTGNSDKIFTVTTETSAINSGIYSGIIKFEYDGKFIDIPVTLDLKTFIDIDETTEFCLDLPEVIISKKNEDAKFVRITLSATYLVLGVTTLFQKVYALPYFLDQAKFGMGEKLHRHFPRIKDHFFNVNNLDLLSKIDSAIKVEELDADRQPIFEQSATGIKLFPGKKPAGYPFLTNYIFRKKNKDSIIFSSLVVADKIEMSKILEKNLSNPLIASIQEIRFWDYPKVFNPVHVQWENQNLVPEWFTFTGDYTISPEFNQVYARSIFNAQNEKYDVTKIKTLNIDTGLILAKERPLIEEMIESKISFIKIGSKVYRCFNITKKMTLESSKEELLSNDLEYLIVEQ